MNIKSILLGSAAALVAVSGARAADAIVIVEPEPVEYVRVCDVYGTGFYYIPGTETCIKTSGYVRFQYNVAGSPATNLEGDDYQAGSSVRARLNFDVREETDLGTLRGYIRLQATNGIDAGDGIRMEHAYLQLGGFLAGYRDTLWSNDIGGIEDGLLTDSDLVVGDFRTNQISYTFASGGFAATLGLEDDRTGDIAPDVHGKISYTGAWGGVYLSGVYDETYNAGDINRYVEFGGTEYLAYGFPFLPEIGVDGSNDAFALKAGLLLEDLLVADSQFKIEGHYAFDPTVYAEIDGVGNAFSISSSGTGTIVNATPGAIPLVLEWAVGAGYTQGFGKLAVGVAGQYGHTFDTAFLTGFSPTAVPLYTTATGDYYSLVGNVGYDLTDNLNLLAEVQYTNVDFGSAVGEIDQTKGFVRIQRNF
ncbi:porin [Aureimonas fodinaquatilis]|uniref:Porin n=1 Tax=Aureimonas fodinaquatilis TaxID=2565783 RepID=A0A5B0DYP1_9HYPH|nr:porin [Aureimonas fodinaquatilis]KAA0970881.1 porin [Aureimonas fodinaquatilis]